MVSGSERSTIICFECSHPEQHLEAWFGLTPVQADMHVQCQGVKLERAEAGSCNQPVTRATADRSTAVACD
jgi:hypothetical protein